MKEILIHSKHNCTSLFICKNSLYHHFKQYLRPFIFLRPENNFRIQAHILLDRFQFPATKWCAFTLHALDLSSILEGNGETVHSSAFRYVCSTRNNFSSDNPHSLGLFSVALAALALSEERRRGGLLIAKRKVKWRCSKKKNCCGGKLKEKQGETEKLRTNTEDEELVLAKDLRSTFSIWS